MDAERQPFAPRTVYTAFIVLAAKEGYTLKGIPANFFTVPGATATNDAGSVVVAARFPETGAASDIDVSFMSATQTGGSSGAADSTGLFLIFDKTPGTLTTDNITVTGATKGLLSSPGTLTYLGISNITVASGATVAVTITGPSGYAITGSPQTAVVYRRLDIGMDYLGGKLAYILQPGDPGYAAGQVHGLIAATADQSTGICWISEYPTYLTSVPGGTGTALGTGSVNTDRIIAQAVAAGNNTPTSYAAGIARACNAGGYSDWYLPSKDELDKLYKNRQVIGAFIDGYFWSSSEYDDSHAWAQLFSDGIQSGAGKCWLGLSVRAVRAF